ncbi:MAG TPA: hypothetical protein VK904_00080 [Miltoncostaeaceae bacterium]|nr:hypothetical protein [Miltoncostaeaceae bacterium]
MHEYRVEFSAVAIGPLTKDAAARLAGALESMPGADGVEGARQDRRHRRVSAAFRLEVRLGMADAARDGSRLAKEALKVAGLGDAQLTELSVALLRDGPAA